MKTKTTSFFCLLCQSTMLLALATLLGPTGAQAQNAVLTLVGTDSDAGVSVQFAIPASSLVSSGLQTTYSVTSATLPPGESFDQINYTGISGVLRLDTFTNTNPTNTIVIARTFELPPYVYNGTYAASGALGTDTGTLTVSNSYSPPTAATLPAWAGANGTQLNGMAVASSLDASCWFQWGVVGDTYPSNTASVDIGTNTAVVYVTNLITAPQPGVQYHCQLVLSNAVGVIYGAERRFGMGLVSMWGDNDSGRNNVPTGLNNVVAMAAGQYHGLALTDGGTVAPWGTDSDGQTNVPAGLSNVVAVAAGDFFSVALRGDGTVAAWGDNGNGQTNVPPGLSNVVAVAAIVNHSLALRRDGTVAAWGAGETNNPTDGLDFGQSIVPPGLSNVVAVAAGTDHSLALRSDGTVLAWGDNANGQTNVPPGLSNVVAVAAGGYHSLALQSDGTVVAWGDDNFGQTNVPPGLSNVVAVAAGQYYSLALRSDGTVLAWGDNANGQTNVPAGLSNVVAIASGYDYSLALSAQNGTTTTLSLSTNAAVYGQPLTLTASVSPANANGTVTFYQGATNGTVLGTGTLAGGSATLSVTNLSLGTNAFVAVYSGNASFLGSTSASTNEVVAPAYIIGLLTAPTNAFVFGQPVVFTIQVNALSPSVAQPGGTVVLYRNGIQMSTNTMTNGFLLVTNTTLPVGTSIITGVYLGNADFYGTGLTGIPHVQVNQAATTVIAGLSPNPSVYGQPVTFAATVNPVAPGAGTPAGTVTFYINGNPGAPVALTNGGATLPGNIVPGGTNAITAVYSGDTNFLGGTSAAANQVVNPANVYNAVFTASPTNAIFGQPVILTLQASAMPPGAIQPGGSIIMTDDGTNYHSYLMTNGLLVITNSALPIGSNFLAATLLSNADFNSVSFRGAAVLVHAATTASTMAPFVGTNGVQLHGLAVPDGLPTECWFRYAAAGTANYTNTTMQYVGSGTATVFVTNTIPASLITLGVPYQCQLVASNQMGMVYGANKYFGSGLVAAWGSAEIQLGLRGLYGLSNVVAVAGGGGHSLALRSNGTAVGWTLGDEAPPTASATNLTAIAVSDSANLGLRANGTVTAWSSSLTSQPTVPAGLTNVVAIAAGGSNYLALLSNGTVYAWGLNAFGETNVPAGLSNVVAVAACASNTLALTASGTVVAWGNNFYGQTNVPAGLTNVVAIAAGAGHSLALNANGTVTAWGNNVYGQSTVPAGLTNVVAIAAGAAHSVALRANGSVVSWGSNLYGQTNVTSGLTNVVGIAAGLDATLALMVNVGTVSTLTASTNIVVTGQPLSLTGISTYLPTNIVGQPLVGAELFYDGGTLLQSNALISTTTNTGYATLSTTNLHLGSNYLTVVYPGYRNFAGSTSAVATVILGQAGTTTALTASANPSAFGQAVTFTATVSVTAPGAGVPAGTVTFFNGSINLGTTTLTNGVATLTTASLAVGDLHMITAVYSGNTNFNGSTSAFWNEVVDSAATTTVTIPQLPPVYGQPVTLTANVRVVAPGAGIPTGTVNFYSGANLLGIGTVSNGSASATTATLPVGTDLIYSVYSGDTNFNGSTSATTNQIVKPAATTSTVISGVNPSVFGQAVTFTAQVNAVAPGAGTPTGMVCFYDGVNLISTTNLFNGLANSIASPLPLGTNQITAVYSGDTNFTGSSSAVLYQAVNSAPTAATLPAWAGTNGTQLNGITMPGDLPAEYWFRWGVVGDDYPSNTPVQTVAGGTTVTYVTNLIAAPQPQVAYHYELVVSNALGMVYGPEQRFGLGLVAGWGTELTNDPGVGEYGSGPYVVPAGLSNVVAVTGGDLHTLALLNDGAVVAWGAGETNDPSDGEDDYGQSIVPPGASNNVVAVSAGGYHSLALTGAGNVVAWGYDFNGQASPPASATNVVAIAGGGYHSLALTSDGQVLAWGAGQTNLPVLGSQDFGQSLVPPGLSNVVAIAAGQFHSLALKSDGTVVAWGAGETNNPSLGIPNYGQSIVPPGLSNVVAIAAGGAHSLALKSDGTVVAWGAGETDNPFPDFFNYGQSLVPAGLSNVVAIAAGQVNSLALQSDGTVVAWGANETNTVNFFTLDFGQSIVPAALTNVVSIGAGHYFSLALTVPVGTTNTLAASTNAAVSGQSVTLTTTVNPAAPGGMVTFYDDGADANGDTNGLALGTATVTNGTAAWTVTNETVGTHNYVAAYAGDISYLGSVSTALNVTANQAGTTNLLVSVSNPSAAAQPLSFTAAINPVAPGAGVPTGNVIFYLGANSFATNTLNDGTATVTNILLPQGTNLISAVYGGDTNFLGSTSVILPQVVMSLTNTQAFSPQLILSTNSPLFFQSGLFQQSVIVSNFTAVTYPAVRLTFHLSASDKANHIVVYNATGTDTNGNPIMQYNFPVAPDSAVVFNVEYYVPNMTTTPTPVITVDLSTPQTNAIPAGAIQPLLQFVQLPADKVNVIAFATVQNAKYYVLYSGDLVTWYVVEPPITGNGSEIQWFDQGPPATPTPPGSTVMRFYKVIKATVQ